MWKLNNTLQSPVGKKVNHKENYKIFLGDWGKKKETKQHTIVVMVAH